MSGCVGEMWGSSSCISNQYVCVNALIAGALFADALIADALIADALIALKARAA